MQFVDEAFVCVEGGNGGHGCLSFCREKFTPHGGPDGGNGGNGGSIYFIADNSLNTLAKFRYRRLLRAQNGQSGMGHLCSGKKGEDLLITVPIGTTVYDKVTDELIGDLIRAKEKLCVARGGRHGFGNAHFKSSTNRTPRKTTAGEGGEQRELKLELKLLADVGLIGLPNAGKSTFITAVSNATPKIADYPFTTLYPHLGVVHVEEFRSFIIADIPGLTKGASAGSGLGMRFLKHLERTQLLLYIVDIAPLDGSNPVEAIEAILGELKQFSRNILAKPKWLVFSKIDLLPADKVGTCCQTMIRQLGWSEPVYQIASIRKEGTEQLCYDLMRFLEKIRGQD
ncbi:Obg family GTPase CgtA [Coxiella endosymbiont of Amblyomma nuttalli]|uniref:Obg family GTPase CgtA n=1 Tax=Coxiella endosymbiont of Amblyomma nuttalli TaxID=2749996 RepID=UPI001BAB5DB0|nr:Obg family GTPase CgtA [Coxiella endosymbiont of Amblyomma nuttalli]QTS84020.1 GTPase Obg [Coxiella endosymbiont of Amblyomma nuttalli]